MGMTGQDIYDNFHQHAQGTDSWQTAQQAATQMAQDMHGQAAQIKRLQDGMEAAWTGDAADASQRGVTPLALEHLNVADDLHTAQDLMARQAASFHQAANAVWPMPPEPAVQDPLAAIMAGQSPDTMLAQVTRYNTIAQHNVDVMTTYEGASRYNSQNMPAAYGTLADSPLTVTINPAPGGDTSTAASGSAATRGAGGTTTSGRTTPPASQPSTSGAGQPSAQSGNAAAAASGGLGGDGGSTATSGSTKAPGGSGSGSADGTATVGSASGSGNAGPRVEEPTPSGMAGDLVGRLGGAAGAAVDAGPDMGADPGAQGGGGRQAGANQTGAPDGGEPARGIPPDPGGQSGVGRAVSGGAMADDETIARPDGQAAGEAGLPGMPAGAGQRGERDDEHHRAYPVATDPEVVFASGIPKVAPEVFGESPEQRAARHASEADGDH